MEVSTSFVAPGTYLISITDWVSTELCCVYVIVGKELAIVETGPAILAEGIVEGLRQLGFEPHRLAKVIVTHIHMDHAGGAGTLARRLPEVQVLVQERGARHLVDPSALVAGTRQVFGDDFARFFGPIEPVPAGQVRALKDGELIDLGRGHTLEVMHTPGHAPHHLCLYDRGNKVLYCGEALGHYYPAHDAVAPSAAPPSFDLQATIADIRRMQAMDISALLFSQTGVSRNPARALDLALRQAKDFDVIVRQALAERAGLQEIRHRLDDYGERNCGFDDRATARAALRGTCGANAEAFIGYLQRIAAKGK